MIDLTTLDPAIWHRAVETTTVGELPPHDGLVLYQVHGGGNMWHTFSANVSAFASHITRYRPVNPDGTTGDIVERATTTERAWNVTPPNDGTQLLVVFSDGSANMHHGKHTQTPWGQMCGTLYEEAWCLLSDLMAPRPVVEVTEAMVDNAFAEIYRYVPPTPHFVRMAAHLTAALAPITPEVSDAKL